MLSPVKLPLILVAGLNTAAYLWPLGGGGSPPARAQDATVAIQVPDTALVRLQISRMTCGSCPTTARLALTRLPGVYSATVTLDDSLGAVRYDPRAVNSARIAAHLTRLTAFGATILSDTTKTSVNSGNV